MMNAVTYGSSIGHSITKSSESFIHIKICYFVDLDAVFKFLKAA